MTGPEDPEYAELVGVAAGPARGTATSHHEAYG